MQLQPPTTQSTKLLHAAYVHFPDLAETINGIVGLEHIHPVLQIIEDRLRSHFGPNLELMDQFDSGGVQCWVKGETREVVQIVTTAIDRLEEPISAADIHCRERSGQALSADTDILVHPYAGICQVSIGNRRTARECSRLCARRAMAYREKVHLYSEKINNMLSRSFRERQAVVSAIRHGQLQQRYEPQIDFNTGMIVGIEALIREPLAKVDDLPSSPARVVEIAAEVGLTEELIRLTWYQAIEARRKLDRLAPDNGVSLAINVHGNYLIDQQEFIVAQMKSLGEPPGITLEIVEETLLDNKKLPALWDASEVVRATGARIAIDDFGTGHSNIDRVQGMEFDELKIDKNLVSRMLKNEHDTNLLLAVIGFARTRKVRVVTEGVETLEQWNTLKAVGADVAQGYIMTSRARSLEDIIARIQRQRRWINVETA